MKPRELWKIIISCILPAVLTVLYGLWLFAGNAGLWEALAAGVCAALLAVLTVRTVYAGFAHLSSVREPAETLCRERRTNAREILRLMTALAAARFVIFAAAYAWNLWRDGYTGRTLFDLQHIWANHPLAESFVNLARRGYAAGEEFPDLSVAPLYALLVRAVPLKNISYIMAAFAVSNVNAILAGVALYELVLFEKDRRSARHAVTLFALMPGAFYLSCTTASSTFLLFSLLCLLALRKDAFILAGVLGALATLTNVTGIVLLLPAAYEFARYVKRTPAKKRSAGMILEGASLLLILAGPVCMASESASLTGGADAFISSRGTDGLFFTKAAESLSGFVCGVRGGAVRLTGESLLELTAVFGSLFLMLAAGKKLPVSLFLYYIGYMLVPCANGVCRNEALACCMAVVCAFVPAAEKRPVYMLLAVVSIILLIGGIGCYMAGVAR